MNSTFIRRPPDVAGEVAAPNPRDNTVAATAAAVPRNSRLVIDLSRFGAASVLMNPFPPFVPLPLRASLLGPHVEWHICISCMTLAVANLHKEAVRPRRLRRREANPGAALGLDESWYGSGRFLAAAGIGVLGNHDFRPDVPLECQRVVVTIIACDLRLVWTGPAGGRLASCRETRQSPWPGPPGHDSAARSRSRDRP